MIRYKAGYKYQLVEPYSIPVEIYPDKDIKTDLIEVTKKGQLTIGKFYTWDGPSGPTFDTKTFMRGSLIHDALYQLLRWNLIAQSERDKADRELRKACLEDGMSKFRAWYVYHAVNLFAWYSASKRSRKPILKAP